ncbi:MAG: helix-turn-helix transcriptional regulator [Phycisphaerae bacterium]|nr:helix-turn-helix transcriptional regulator [Phycisphaerae bacterium]
MAQVVAHGPGAAAPSVEATGSASPWTDGDRGAHGIRATAERFTPLPFDLGSLPARGDCAGGARRGVAGPPSPFPWVLPENVLWAAVPLQDPPCARVLCLALASADGGNPGPAADVLRAALPLLARRARLALGADRRPRERWLSVRELAVLERLVRGDSIQEIAAAMGRSPHTVHDHVKALHRKLGAASRAELIARALGASERLKPDGGARVGG